MIPEQHRERLNGCDPVLVEKAGKLINALELRGIEVMVAWRAYVDKSMARITPNDVQSIECQDDKR